MKIFLHRVEAIIKATIVAKVFTCILILLRVLSPPPFPFFQVHWLISLSLIESIVVLCLRSRGIKTETKLAASYLLGWMFGSIYLVFQVAKITSCPCLGSLTAYDTFLALLARLLLLAFIGYMVIGSSWHLASVEYGRRIDTSW